MSVESFRTKFKTILKDIEESRANSSEQIENFFKMFREKFPKEYLNKSVDEFFNQMNQINLNEKSINQLFDVSVESKTSSTEKTTKIRKAVNFKIKKPNGLKRKSTETESETDVEVEENVTFDSNTEVVKKGKSENGVKIIYFLQDKSQVTSRLDLINVIDLSLVHEDCREDLKTIRRAIKPNSNGN